LEFYHDVPLEMSNPKWGRTRNFEIPVTKVMPILLNTARCGQSFRKSKQLIDVDHARKLKRLFWGLAIMPPHIGLKIFSKVTGNSSSRVGW
jgi:hypothetical protein